MSSLARARGAASKTLAVVLLAGILMLAAESSQAARHDDRGSARGGRPSMGDSRAHRGDARAYGGGSRDRASRGQTGDTVVEAAHTLPEFLSTVAVAGRMRARVVALTRVVRAITAARATTDPTATGRFGREAS